MHACFLLTEIVFLTIQIPKEIDGTPDFAAMSSAASQVC